MELAANQSKTVSQSGTIQAFIRHSCLVREATAPGAWQNAAVGLTLFDAEYLRNGTT